MSRFQGCRFLLAARQPAERRDPGGRDSWSATVPGCTCFGFAFTKQERTGSRLR
ncbi:MAG: hypothetical protein M1568_00190 [Acidobacteria bacterium]|nr:hypothetical protein [Acidobacteriota bacterium]